MPAATPSDPIRVAVVNDYPVVAAGVAAMMADHGARVTVQSPMSGGASTGGLADVDVVLFDTFGRAELLVRVEKLASEGPKIVVFTADAAPELVAMLLERGAAGFVHKSASAELLVDAVEAAHRGDQPIHMVNSNLDPGDHPEVVDGYWPGKLLGLTSRESEMLSLITQGLTNGEIADRTFLSINTVKTYVRTAYRKIGVSRRSQAVSWGIQNGFHPDDPADE